MRIFAIPPQQGTKFPVSIEFDSNGPNELGGFLAMIYMKISKTLINAILLVIALLLFIGIWNAWGPILLLINTVIALIALKFIGWLGIRIEISIWSILICLAGGIPGLLILILLSVTGIAFKGKK